MKSIEWEELGLEDIVRLIRSLGAHRYVAKADVRVHALVIDGSGEVAGLEDAQAQARTVLADGSCDPASRAPELWIEIGHKELAALLEAYWCTEGAEARRAALKTRLESLELPIDAECTLFDEGREQDIHPVLVDAGWELFRLSELDPERHRGVIDAFDDALSFASARFEEESAIPPPEAYALELPAFGAEEVLFAPERAPVPFVVWVNGPEPYLDYLLRGVAKVAKIAEPF
ncbi:MAG: hypothetical protein U0174_20950 [Polyangiaceae bacterium]